MLVAPHGLLLQARSITDLISTGTPSGHGLVRPSGSRRKLRHRRRVKRLRPLTISYRSTPSAQMSVRASVRLAAHLFGRHRVGRARGDPGRHQGSYRRRVDAQRVVAPGQPEIDNLQPAVPR